ncbi:RHS repeat domain-containing protein [Sporosarcina sp. P1]|uniref:RHS repeat domain-containing protein n=1 Tax=Sporosarcina sp. P1 TaxID=2048257 RepID=UPI000C166CB3|nr:RHS repeat-associated core domain-containing protein [Sporosarcina sp. P1]PIC82958.1 hypothetical protein CSV73_09530 [Sporosarcina sp. P1]
MINKGLLTTVDYSFNKTNQLKSVNGQTCEEDPSGNLTKAYTYDDNGNPLTMTYQGETYYYLTNYRGDVLALVNKSGERVATYTYDAWGNILTQPGPMASENPYRYAGYRYDEVTKLYYLMARYYNPDTGVFLSLDPVRGDTMNPITMNGYSYANNNPVINVDPEGIFAWAIVGAISGGLIAWGIYTLEVKLKIRKYSRNSLFAKIGASAGLGALSGGISGVAKFGGLLNRSLKAGILTKREVSLYKKFITVKHFVTNSAVNIGSKKPGSETWTSFVTKKMRRLGIPI